MNSYFAAPKVSNWQELTKWLNKRNARTRPATARRVKEAIIAVHIAQGSAARQISSAAAGMPGVLRQARFRPSG